MQPFFVQLLDLLFIQMTNWRWSWRGTIIFGVVAPVFLTIALSAFATERGSLIYILSGNVVLSLLFQGLGNLSSYFSYMRMGGQLDYFATLPIGRLPLILATVIAFLLIGLPSVVGTLIVGALILELPITFDPLLILLIPLISVSLSGLGALIGIVARTPTEVNTLTNVATFVLFGFGPVIIPADRLPPLIQTLSLLSPATYAASALRTVLFRTPEPIPLWIDLIVLTGLASFLLWWVTRRIDWRART